MISFDDIVELNHRAVAKYGGLKGIRDQGLLESAIARPFQTFGGEELYPDVFFKAAALVESLVINHPFLNGNKRTGFLAMAGLLLACL